MRKIITILLLLRITVCAAQQNQDYRTLEDGVSQLVNNADFIDRVGRMNGDELAQLTLQQLFAEYVPDYSDFKVDKSRKIDLKKIFFEKGKTQVNEQLSKYLGKLLNFNPTELENFKSLLSGKIAPGWMKEVPGMGMSSELNTILNNPAGYLKSELSKKMGGGPVTEKLVNFGFNWLAQKEAELEEEEEIAKQAKERRDALAVIQKQYDDAQSQLTNQALKELTDAYIAAIEYKYDDAIEKYTNAITLYKQADGKEYELMKCYQSRAYCKNGKGDYRSAIVDNYLALTICNKLLSNVKKNNSNNGSDLSSTFRIQTMDASQLKETKNQSRVPDQIEKYKIITNRAYSKFLAGDYAAAIEDCKMGLEELKAIDPEQLDWTKRNFNDGFTAGGVDLGIMMLASEINSTLYNLIGIAGLSCAAQKNYSESERYLKYITLIKVSDLPKYDFQTKEDMLFARNQFSGLPNYFGGQLFQTKVFVLTKQNKVEDALGVLNYITRVGWALQLYGGVDVSKFHLSKATLYAGRKEYTKAIFCMDSCIELKPKETSFYKLRSDLKKLAGDTKGAKEDLLLVTNPNALSTIRPTLFSLQNDLNKSQGSRNRSDMEKILLDAIKYYPDTAWTIINTIDYSFQWIFIGDVGKVPSVFQSAIFSIEKIDQLLKTIPENSNISTVLNAIKYGINKDSKNCYPLLSKFWDIPFGSDLFDMRKAGLISKILPDYDQYPEYCTYAKSFILHDNAAMYGPVKAVYRNQIESKDKTGVSTYLYVSTANNYLMLGEFENALIYCDKEINGEGKPKYLKTFTPEVIKTKIKALLALDRNKEAVETAKKYSSPKKNYEMTSEEDGKQVEYKECAFIRNIAQDYCGGSK